MKTSFTQKGGWVRRPTRALKLVALAMAVFASLFTIAPNADAMPRDIVTYLPEVRLTVLGGGSDCQWIQTGGPPFTAGAFSGFVGASLESPDAPTTRVSMPWFGTYTFQVQCDESEPQVIRITYQEIPEYVEPPQLDPLWWLTCQGCYQLDLGYPMPDGPEPGPYPWGDPHGPIKFDQVVDLLTQFEIDPEFMVDNIIMLGYDHQLTNMAVVLPHEGRLGVIAVAAESLG